ncbi:TonB-dependent receptor plug domain-containing protein [Sphingomonas sp. MMS24-JH45]
MTARRKDENLQDVPISVGAIGTEELQSRQIYSLTALRQAVANLTVSKLPVAGGNFLTIRGVTGTSIPNVSVDSSIGIYIDGVDLGRPQSSGGDIADIERVEVNRGPQGTLFGRNSSAGSINFITVQPSGTGWMLSWPTASSNRFREGERRHGNLRGPPRPVSRRCTKNTAPTRETWQAGQATTSPASAG